MKTLRAVWRIKIFRNCVFAANQRECIYAETSKQIKFYICIDLGRPPTNQRMRWMKTIRNERKTKMKTNKKQTKSRRWPWRAPARVILHPTEERKKNPRIDPERMPTISSAGLDILRKDFVSRGCRRRHARVSNHSRCAYLSSFFFDCCRCCLCVPFNLSHDWFSMCVSNLVIRYKFNLIDFHFGFATHLIRGNSICYGEKKMNDFSV